jgi:hypothetical protein
MGEGMRAIFSLVVVLVLGAGCVGAADFPEIPGWAAAGEVQTFGPDNLWEYINGAADAFLGYGFQSLSVREISAGDVTVAASMYDMGTPVNAFGIYRSEAPPEADRVAIGGEAVVMAPYQCLLLKGPYYVKVDVYDGELSEDAGKKLVAALAGALPGSDGLPAPVRALPEGMVPGSEGYTRESYLGLSELDSCVHATYGEGDAERQVFIIATDEGDSADAAWKRLASSWTAVEHEGFPVLAKRVPYSGLVGVKRTADGIVGVAGAADTAALIDWLTSLE